MGPAGSGIAADGGRLIASVMPIGNLGRDPLYQRHHDVMMSWCQTEASRASVIARERQRRRPRRRGCRPQPPRAGQRPASRLPRDLGEKVAANDLEAEPVACSAAPEPMDWPSVSTGGRHHRVMCPGGTLVQADSLQIRRRTRLRPESPPPVKPRAVPWWTLFAMFLESSEPPTGSGTIFKPQFIDISWYGPTRLLPIL